MTGSTSRPQSDSPTELSVSPGITASPGDTSSSGDTPPKSVVRTRSLLLLLSAAAIGGLSWFFWGSWNRSPIAVAPVIEIRDANPALLAALQEAKHAVDEEPRSGAAWGHYGMLLMQHEQFGEALRCFAEAIRLDPTHAQWYYFCGVMLEQSDRNEALRYLLRAGQHAPQYAPLSLRIAALQISLGQFDAAAEVLEGVCERSPETSQAWVQLVRLERLQGTPCDAAGRLNTARTHNAVSSDLLREAASAELQCGHPDQARQLAAEAATLFPAAAPVDPWMAELRQLDCSGTLASSNADVLRQQGRLEQASITLAMLARRFPDRSRPALNHALTLRDLGKMNEAIRELNSLVGQFPDDPMIRFHQAVVLVQSGGDPNLAIDALKEALQRKPDYGVARAALADLLNAQGRRAEALEAYAQAVQDAPDDPWIRFAYAAGLIEQGRRNDAERQLNDASALLDAEHVDEQQALTRLRQQASEIGVDMQETDTVEKR